MKLQLEKTEYYERYYKKDCGVCGKDRLCYAIIEQNIIHGYVCRNCKYKLKLKNEHI